MSTDMKRLINLFESSEPECEYEVYNSRKGVGTRKFKDFNQAFDYAATWPNFRREAVYQDLQAKGRVDIVVGDAVTTITCKKPTADRSASMTESTDGNQRVFIMLQTDSTDGPIRGSALTSEIVAILRADAEDDQAVEAMWNAQPSAAMKLFANEAMSSKALHRDVRAWMNNQRGSLFLVVNYGDFKMVMSHEQQRTLDQFKREFGA